MGVSTRSSSVGATEIWGGDIQYYVVKVPSEAREAAPFKSWMELLLGRVFPVANPDFEHKYQDVSCWWLETDDNWLVHRELGFDHHNEVIVAAPVARNPGVFTDQAGRPFRPDGTIEPRQFEDAWREFAARYPG